MVDNARQGDEQRWPRCCRSSTTSSGVWRPATCAASVRARRCRLRRSFTTYLRLLQDSHLSWQNRAFFGIAARSCDRSSSSGPRPRCSQARRQPIRVTFDAGLIAAPQAGLDLEALDQARRARGARRGSRPRGQCGFSAACRLRRRPKRSTSPATVKRRWTLAKAWLARELAGRYDVTFEEWTRVRELFEAALTRIPSARRVPRPGVRRQPAVRAEVTSLLDAHERPPDFIAPACSGTPICWRTAAGIAGRPHAGTRIIRHEIGRGGMGIVYLADDTRLSVAYIEGDRAGAGSDAKRRARMWQEARVAAGLSHPGIATVYALERSTASCIWRANTCRDPPAPLSKRTLSPASGRRHRGAARAGAGRRSRPRRRPPRPEA